jgi:hypothetical protein
MKKLSVLLVLLLIPFQQLTAQGITTAAVPNAITRSSELINTEPGVSDYTQPQVWFSPLPILPRNVGRPFIGSEDFMDLFTTDAPWGEAAARVQVFKLYGEWVAYNATDAELAQVIADLNRRGIAIAFEAGPLTPTDSCGQGIEGFTSVEENLRIAQRIQKAGGTAQYVAFDHPYDAGALNTSENACHWTAQEVAENAALSVAAIRSVFPNIIVGDIETADHNMKEIARWVDACNDAFGEDLGFLHMDINYSLADWAKNTREIEDYLRTRGVAFGIIYFGDRSDESDEAWLSNTGERIKTYELDYGGQPDQVVFQSWHDHPDHVLPESDAYSFTWFINQYLDDKTSLGFRAEGPGANLAIGKTVKASRTLAGFDAERAVDGSLETWWCAGDFPKQWIEIYLEGAYSIAAINLLTSQSPEGVTEHVISVKGAGERDKYQVIHTFKGSTGEQEWLNLTLKEALTNIRYVRIETLKSPSWVAWREIQVIAAE